VSSLAAALRGAIFYDVSPVIDARIPVFPGHPPVEIDTDARTHARDGYFVQRLRLGEHVGAHVDAPAHAVERMPEHTIDVVPVDRFIAPYVKLDVSSFEPGAGDLVTADMLEAVERRDGVRPREGEVAIVQFGWDRHFHPESDDRDEREWWIRNAPGLSDDACAHLVDCGVGGVGTDTATADSAVVDGQITSDVGHTRWFLPNGILIFEGLVGLGRAPAVGLFIGLPLRIRGGSGSPIRAVLVGVP
jgi:arylformamidase